MAITIIWDLTDDGEVELRRNEGGRIVRTGLVRGLTTSVTTSRRALMDAISAGAPAENEQHPDFPEYVCTYRVARGVPRRPGTFARIWAHYETPSGTLTPIETYAAEDVTNLVAVPTQRDPITGVSLTVTVNNVDPTVDDPTDPRHKVCTINYPREFRSLIFYGLFSDRPSAAYEAATNCVNSETVWGLPRGYWLCGGARVRFSNRDGLYAVSQGVTTQVDRDWSEYQFARDAFGETVRVADSVITPLLSAQYEPGIQYRKNGLLKVGPFNTYPLHTIFPVNLSLGQD